MKQFKEILPAFFIKLVFSGAFIIFCDKAYSENDSLLTDSALIPVSISPQELFTSCARCHSIGQGKLIGPDLKGFTERHSREWLINFIRSSETMIKSGDTTALRLFHDNENLPMPDHNFTAEEATSLIDYIEAEEKKLKADPGFLNNSFNFAPPAGNWLFIAGILLFILSLFDLFFTKIIRYRAIHIFLLLSGLVLVGKAATTEAVNLGRSLGYEPDQPIKFSHKIHAGENKISCDYCHTGANKSKHASIPPASLCLNCHNVIRSGTNTGESEIEKIHQYVESGKPVPWVKVYNLPDHVFFSHAQHVNVGKVDCKTCHGDVADMGRIQQVNDLGMGWCINCHRETAVNFDNKYYTSYKQHELLKEGKISHVTVDDIGGNNCQKCHY